MTLTDLNTRLQDHSLFQQGGLIFVKYPNNAKLRENLHLLFPLFQRGPWPVEEIVEQQETNVFLPAENKPVFCVHLATESMFDLIGEVLWRLRKEAIERRMLVVVFTPLNYPDTTKAYIGTPAQLILSRILVQADLSLNFALDEKEEPVFYVDKLRGAESIGCQKILHVAFPVNGFNMNLVDPYANALQTRLRHYVQGCRDEDDGYPDYLPTDKAIWQETSLSLEELEMLFTEQMALDWLANEITLFHREGNRANDYLQMLATGINDPVVVTVSPNGELRVGDGWHRIAISVIRREPVKAVVGYSSLDLLLKGQPHDYTRTES